jgi:outer membrane protein OmpA-like peptidoglycan-associated protein
MRIFLHIILFLIFIGAKGQDLDRLIGQSQTAMASISYDTNEYEDNASLEEDAFISAARENNIAQRVFRNDLEAKNGYYAIAGVFSNPKKLDKQVKKLNGKGFKAGYFQNPENKLYYLFLNRYDHWKSAMDAMSSQFNGTYDEQVWALMVANPNVEKAKIPLEEVTYKDLANSIVPEKGSSSGKQKERTGPKSNFNTKQYENSTSLEEDAFISAARANNIPQRVFRNDLEAKNGYYAIAGVFSNPKKLDKQVKKLNGKGFKAGYFQNPENKLYYLFINRYDHWKSAMDAMSSQFNGAHDEQVWALMVANPNVEKAQIPLEEVTYNDLANNIFPQKGSSSGKQKEKKGLKSIMMKRADEYFDKMWYAEAAKLYEQALEGHEGNYSFEVLQKVGDAHYFNTNMQQAYKWYTILYEKYGDAFSADNIFKYAHSLKGNGKYGRSKRLMRLYNKKVVEKGLAKKEILNEREEAVLDELMYSLPKYEIKDAGINTEYSEFSPMYHMDQVVFASAKDSSVFSTRRYKWDNQPYLDLYTAKLNAESQELKDAIKFSKEINTKYHEASVAFTPDGETMYFTRNNYGKKLRRDRNGINHLKIYVSKKVDGAWTEATEVSFNSDDYSTGHPTLSKDGKKMYFVSDMPGSIGGTDIFVVDILEDGSFSTPKNLGPEVNTEQKEMFPFIHNEKLFFSSNGHTGLGGLDVYEATLGEEGGFSGVKNLGKPINSNKDDFSYIINDENEKGFFASNRDGGKGRDDIYSFKKIQPEEIQENVNAIAGIVVDVITGDVMPKALVELLDENNVKLKEIETDDDGKFIFEDLEANTKYTLRTTKETYFENTMQVSTLENDTVTVDNAMRKLQGMVAVENGIRKLKTEMIHFDFDTYYIRPDAADELKKLVSVMNEYPNMVIKIESHTDSRGSAVYNEYLSDKRAKSTRDYIISQGIAPERIESAIGYGENRLLNECDGTIRCKEEMHYLNRRSEFIIVKM